MRRFPRTAALSRALIKLLVVLPLWCLGLACLLLGLALSPWGSSLLLKAGEAGGYYRLEAIEGAPLDRWVLHGLTLEAGPAQVAVERFELAWAEDCLLRGRLCLERLAVSGARVRLAAGDDRASPDTDAGPIAPITLPLPLELRALTLTDIDVRLADGTRIQLDRMTSGARGAASRLELLPTRLSGLSIALPLTPGARLALSEAEQPGPRLSAAAIDAALAVRSPLPAAAAELEGLAASATDGERLTLPTVRLPLAITAPEVIVEAVTLSGPVDYALQRIALSLNARDHRIAVTPLTIASLDTDATLEARVELRDDYPLTARLDAALWLPERVPELAGERLTLTLDGSLAALDAELAARGPVEARLSAHLDALDPALAFRAELESPLLQWPLPARGGESPADGATAPPAEPYLAEDVALRLEGDLNAYQAALSLKLEGPQIPYLRVALSGQGDLTRFAWEPLSVAQDEASLVSHGQVDWAEGLDLRAALRLEGIDPGRFTDAPSGRLNGDAELRFQQDTDGWRLAVPRVEIGGELDGRPLTLSARLSGDSEQRWDIARLDFRQGENHLSASGSVSTANLDLSGELDLPALSSLHATLNGSLAGRIRAAGSLEAPQLELTLEGANLAVADTRLTTLRLSGESRGREDPVIELDLRADGLNAGGQRLERIDLMLAGRLSEHRLSLDARGGAGMPLSQASLRLAGGLDTEGQRYTGRIDPLSLASDYGDLALDTPLAFRIDLADARAEVQPFCLRREQGGRACLDQPLDASATQGAARLSLSELPLALLGEALPPAWQAAGSAAATLSAEWREGGDDWRAQAELNSRLDLRGEDAYGQPWRLPEARLTARLDADPARAAVDLDLTLAGAGQATLALEIRDPLGGGELDGRLRLDGLALSPYRALAAGLDTLDGRLDGTLAIRGSRDAPQLEGRLALVGLQASGGAVPLVVRDGEVRVALDGQRGRIDGYVATDDGRLAIDGEAAWPAPDDWRLQIRLDGTDEPLLLAMPAFGRLRVAPDVRVAVTPSRLQVRGDVQVPWARLEVGQQPAAAVTPSPDEVIISEQEDARLREQDGRPAGGADAATAAALNQAGMAVDVRLDLRLGPDMQLEAYGLSTALAGTLQVRQQNGPVQLFGDVNLRDGRFRAFGQDLLIRQGELLFSGAPDQPLLDFEAIRNPEVTEDGVIAGLRVEGFAAEPRLTIFSEPAMDEARALSYLLRGRAPQDSDTDGALTSALIGLTVGQTGGAVGAIGEAFGIEDLALETAGGGEDSQVVLSGYLTDDLRISYGVGIFSPIAELALRYTLWRNLYLEAVSGAAQAVDLIYAFSLPGEPQVVK